MALSTAAIVALMVFVLVVLLAVMSSGIKVILPYERALYLRLGRFVRVLPPGISFVTPLVNQIIRIDMRHLEFEYPANEMTTNDRERVSLTIKIGYAVKDPAKVFFSVANHKVHMQSSAQTELMTIVSGLRKDEALSQLNSISSQLEKRMKETGESLGIEVGKVRVLTQSDA